MGPSPAMTRAEGPMPSFQHLWDLDRQDGGAGLSLEGLFFVERLRHVAIKESPDLSQEEIELVVVHPVAGFFHCQDTGVLEVG